MPDQAQQSRDEGVVDSARDFQAKDETVSSSAGRWVLVATILGSSLTFIDGTVINVALPILQEKLQASASEVQWVVESYALMLSALILVGGALGDKKGRRKIFNLGVVIFTAASVVCGAVSEINLLIIARAAQGVGAALLVPGSLAIISVTFDKKSRAKAIGTWSGFTAISAGLGPVLGGWLVDNVSWRWIFFINLPLAVIILAISIWKIPETRDPEAAGSLDWPGALLATAGLCGVVYGLTESSNPGFTNTSVLVSLIFGAAALAVFIFVEIRSRNPMLPLELFGSKTFTGANLLTFFLYGALSGILFFLPFNLIQIQGYEAAAAGAALVPFVLTMFLLSRPASGLIDRFGPRLPLVAGPLMTGIGFALFSLAPVRSASYWRDFFPAILVMSLGMTLSVAPLTTTVMTAVEERHAGIASGINNAVSRTAALIAIAVFGVVVMAAFNSNLDRKAGRLTPEAQAELKNQRYKMAKAKLPANFDEQTRLNAQQIVEESFVDGFRYAAYLAALLAFLSALCAGLLIEGKSPQSDKTPFGQ